MAIGPGDKVRIQCDVRPGPFSGERLISFESLEGIISGFVKERELEAVGGEWYISGVVQEVHQEDVVVKVRGSFFTTNGIASMSRNLAVAA